MKLLIIFAVCLIPSLSTNGQTRTITGKVLDEHLETLAQVRIQNVDTLELGKTDLSGNFKIELPLGTDQLLLSSIGMEWTSLKLPANCDYLEIIMLDGVIYDFISINSINRKRYRRFRDLPKKHRQANEKAIFISRRPCLSYLFSKY
jgi:hypothetical protein